MTDTWTVRRMLGWMAEDFASRGVASPRLDAELLLARALGCDRVRIYMDAHRPLERGELDAIRALVQRRRAREPVAYILGEKEFYRRGFEVDPAVLIPRPETELLVDRALELLAKDARGPVLDVGAGSGVLAVTLAAERPGLRVDATDVSAEALAMAGQNAERHGVATRVRLLRGSLFDPVEEGARYALIVSNPPYVEQAAWEELEPEITRHEPPGALLAGVDGLDVIRPLVVGAPKRLLAGGVLLVEIGAGQADGVERLMVDAGALAVSRHRDLAGVERVIEASFEGEA